jgi:hypothetical protein
MSQWFQDPEHLLISFFVAAVIWQSFQIWNGQERPAFPMAAPTFAWAALIFGRHLGFDASEQSRIIFAVTVAVWCLMPRSRSAQTGTAKAT